MRDSVRVLYVDHKPAVIDSVRSFLEAHEDQIEVQTANSLANGRELLENNEFDCIVSAYDLPEESGIQFLKSVRTDDSNRPFILYPSSGSEAIASDAISAGVTDYLPRDGDSENHSLLADRITAAVDTYRADQLSAERARDLLDQTEQIAAVGGWEIDTETMDVFWTDHLFEILGVDDDEEPPLDEALDVYHEADRPIVEDAVETALESGEAFDIEVRFRRPDGEIRWLRVQGTPTVVDGEVVTLRGAVQDVTERRTRERLLHEMYEIISDRSQSFEQQVRALLELARTELGTQYGTLSEIRGDDYLFEVVAADDETIQEGDIAPVAATNCEIVASSEQTLVCGDIERDAPEETDRAGFQEWGICCYIGAPVYMGEDVYGTFCLYGTDPREGQFSEWEQTLVDLMSRWVSYELERQQVTERLQGKNEQLEQFASIVSHDLRNPLNVASLQLELAQDACESDHLTEVAEAHDRMQSLIEDLLSLTREGDTVTDYEQVDLGTVVEQCWSNVLSTEATLVVETTKHIQADKSRLKQLFENLFRNAIEHGGDDVTVTVGDLERGFYVEDDGSGISGDTEGDIFEPGVSTAVDGTGFGLSIVKQIVDAHNWDVRVSAGQDGGARFEITGIEFAAN